jgi:hypothetical protein
VAVTKHFATEQQALDAAERLVEESAHVDSADWSDWLLANADDISALWKWRAELAPHDIYAALIWLMSELHPSREHRTLTELSRELKIGRSTILNWSARFEDFPHGAAIESGGPYYDLGLVREFMSRHGLTGRRKNNESQPDVLRQIWSSLPAPLTTDERAVLLLSLAREMRDADEKTKTQSILRNVWRTLKDDDLAIASKVRIGADDSVRAKVLTWLTDIGQPILSRVSTQEVLSFVRLLLRDDRQAQFIAGSPSIGLLIATLLPNFKKIVDLTPSSGYLLDAFVETGASMVAVCPTPTLGLVARYASVKGTREVVISDWLHEPLPLSLDATSLLVGVAPTNSSQKRPSKPQSSEDPRWLIPAKTTNPVDLFLQHVVSAMPQSGTAAVVVPTKWCDSPAHDTLRTLLLKLNVIEKVIRLVPHLVPGSSSSTLLILRRGRPDDDQSCLLLSDSNIEGVLVGKRLRDLSSDDCEFLRQGLEEESVDTPDGYSSYDFRASPFKLTLAEALKRGGVLTEDQYRGAPNRIALNDESFVEDVRGGLSSLQKLSRPVLETAAKVFEHERTSHAGVNSVPLAEVAAITFLQRGPGKEWTSDQISDEDIVINLLGKQAGETCRGRAEQIEAFVRIARVRVANLTVVDVEYLNTWLSYMGKQMPVSGSHTVKRIGRPSVANLRVPLPAIEVQKRVGRQVKQVRDARRQAQGLAATFQDLEKRLPEKLLDELMWGQA